MKTQVITLSRTITYTRSFELPHGVELSPELLDKVGKALNIETPVHEMKEVDDVTEVLVAESDSNPASHKLRLEGEKVFVTVYGVERELDLIQV